MVKVYAYRIFLVSLVIVLTIVGIFVGLQISKNKSINEAVDVLNNQDDATEVKENDDKVNIYEPVIAKTYDIELVYEDYYTLCRESVINKNVVYGVTLSDLKEREKEKQERLKEKYEIVEENNSKLVYKRKIDKYCPNHFDIVLNESEDKVVIYSLEDKNTKTLYQEMEIYKDTLRNELIEKLRDGIKVDSKKELNLIIEDIEI